MSFDPGVVHTPLTPFATDRRIDFDRYGTLIDFHLRHGADALAVPMHVGESVSVPDAEKRRRADFVLPTGVSRAETRAKLFSLIACLRAHGIRYCRSCVR